MGKPTKSIKPKFYKFDDRALANLLEDKNIVVSDFFSQALEEFFEIEHPWLKKDFVYDQTLAQYKRDWLKYGSYREQGVWVYYPWMKTVVHLPPNELFFKIRTSRNRDLVTEREQQILSQKCIGIAGLSVGSNILNTLVLTGHGRYFKIADNDTISFANTNRVMAPVTAINENKAVFFAKRSFEVDPFLKIDVFSRGIQLSNFEKFFKKPLIDIFVEEMDDPYLKIQARKYARRYKIPLVMATDNGDGVFVDVERYDQSPAPEIFNGRVKSVNFSTVERSLTFAQKLALISEMAGLNQATMRMQESIEKVGTVLNTWPQLGTAALCAGVAVTYVVRQILLGYSMPSRRYFLSLESLFNPDFHSKDKVVEREKKTQLIMKNFRAFQRFIKKIENI